LAFLFIPRLDKSKKRLYIIATENQLLKGWGMPTKKLSELRPGEFGVVERVTGSGPFRQRLLEMGLTRGVRVGMEKTAPLGDPTEYVVKGYHISLRKGEADLIVLSFTSEEAV
jgi:ferrous iron transport protein A